MASSVVGHMLKHKKSGGKKWIQGAVKHPGSYGHHSLAQIHRDETKGGKIAKKANLAETLRNLHK